MSSCSVELVEHVLGDVGARDAPAAGQRVAGLGPVDAAAGPSVSAPDTRTIVQSSSLWRTVISMRRRSS